MNSKIRAMILPIVCMMLSGCAQSASQYSPTLSKLGPNMQDQMEQELVATGSWSMQPNAKPTAQNALPLNSF